MTTGSQVVALTVLILASAPVAHAQATTQLWGNLTFNWVKSERLVYELDLEPKGLLSAPEGDPDWRNLDVTPNVEVLAEGLDGHRARHFGGLDAADRRCGHAGGDAQAWRALPSLLAGAAVPPAERAPRRRIVVRDLVRLESRNLFSSGAATGSDATVRFRNRLEFLIPLNKERMTDDGARYWMADWEWFVPLDDPEERFANRQRIRTGLGYRRSFNWRYELFYIWTRSRNTIEDGFSTTENIIDVRVKRLF